jgi:WGR domain/Recombinase
VLELMTGWRGQGKGLRALARELNRLNIRTPGGSEWYAYTVGAAPSGGDPVSAVTLTRSVPARNMHCYHRLDVQRDLFGQWCCIPRMGRIGSAASEALGAFDQQAARAMS